MRISRVSRRGRASVGVALFAALAAITAALVGATAAGAAAPAGSPIVVNPQHSGLQKPGAAQTFSCQAAPLGSGNRCYTPAQIQTAYGYSPLLAKGIDGTGRTIVIVDAYSNPDINDDLSNFDSTFDLPTPNFSVIAPQGMTPWDITDPNQVGWSGEISLDVQWAHAMAPGASIVLDLAKTGSDQDIYNATKYAVDHNIGDVISQSFGEAEQCMDPTVLREQHQLFAQAVAKGITVFASSGDSGASQSYPDCQNGTTPFLAASTPASDPNVTAVGGTTLNADSVTGAYIGETAWTEPLYGCNPPDSDDINCSGGGFSSVYGRPVWQPFSPQAKGHGRVMRGVPDVAYNAGVDGGVLTHWGVGLQAYYGADPDLPYFFAFGGTSAGSPQWSALAADADQLGHHRMGLINPALYGIAASPLYHAAFHDVTTGNNTVADLGGLGYQAGPGWDPVTGLGTPNAQVLLPALAAATLFQH